MGSKIRIKCPKCGREQKVRNGTILGVCECGKQMINKIQPVVVAQSL